VSWFTHRVIAAFRRWMAASFRERILAPFRQYRNVLISEISRNERL
jgi:hypothetical protein